MAHTAAPVPSAPPPPVRPDPARGVHTSHSCQFTVNGPLAATVGVWASCSYGRTQNRAALIAIGARCGTLSYWTRGFSLIRHWTRLLVLLGMGSEFLFYLSPGTGCPFCLATAKRSWIHDLIRRLLLRPVRAMGVNSSWFGTSNTHSGHMQHPLAHTRTSVHTPRPPKRHFSHSLVVIMDP